MNTKLTLKLGSNFIKKAKNYSKNKKISLSKLVEKFFSTLDVESKKPSNINNKISPVVKDLSGILDVDNNYDIKKFKKNRLKNKYI